MDAGFKPYLIRAMYEWCVDHGYEPYLAVAVDDSCTVPKAYVHQGQIVLDISPESIKDLDLGRDAVSFQARFAGTVHQLYAPMHRIIGLFPTHDQNLGCFFEPTDLPAMLNPDASDADTANNPNNLHNKAKKTASLAKSKIIRVK
jgi:stringent starvation protein B